VKRKGAEGEGKKGKAGVKEMRKGREGKGW